MIVVDGAPIPKLEGSKLTLQIFIHKSLSDAFDDGQSEYGDNDRLRLVVSVRLEMTEQL